MINFGVILNESMEDSVKITVIATGFQPPVSPEPKRTHIVWNRVRRWYSR